MKIRRDYVDYLYFGIFGIIIILFVTNQFSAVSGTTLVVIDNPDPNSMFPTYFQGDLFVIFKHNPADISIGDVIVYSLDGQTRVIHRVIDIVQNDGNYYFRVKGDDPITNFTPDLANGGTLIKFDQVLGKVVARIPYLGHLSLAMQRNFVVQMLIYLTAIGITLTILFSSSEEEEEKYYEFTKAKLNEFKQGITNRLAGLRSFLTSSPYRFVGWMFIILLATGLILPIFLPTFLPMGEKQNQIGIYKVEINHDAQIAETFPFGDIQFFNISVHMFDDSNQFQHISGYTLQVKDPNGKVIDETVWKTRRIIKGNFMVGGSITIDADIFATFATGTQLTAIIVVHVDSLFSNRDLAPFSTPFNVEANHVSLPPQ